MLEIIVIAITALMAAFTLRTSAFILMRLYASFVRAWPRKRLRRVAWIVGLAILVLGHAAYYPMETALLLFGFH